MKVVIINCFDTYGHRVDLIEDYFEQSGHSVTRIESDFLHFEKRQRISFKYNSVIVPTRPYKKNLSFTRMLSHYEFARKAVQEAMKISPDLLYVLLPPNALAKYSSYYKSVKNDITLIFDLIDLWPETLPVNYLKDAFPFQIWRNLRDKFLNKADYIISECDLYLKVLHGKFINIPTATLYLARNASDIVSYPKYISEDVHICWLGSINNIIDISGIVDLIKIISLYKPVVFHIIGDGESKISLIHESKKAGATVVDHGVIYDRAQKQVIFDQCRIALNMMKDSVCVGLTMKSIDYFEAGVPLVNSIPGDTAELVEKYKSGFNINKNNLNEIAKQIAMMEYEDYLKIHNNTRQVFLDTFTSEVFIKKLDQLFES